MQATSNHSLSSLSSEISLSHQNLGESFKLQGKTKIVFERTSNSSASIPPLPSPIRRATPLSHEPSFTDDLETSLDNLSKILSNKIEHESEDETNESESEFTDNESESEFGYYNQSTNSSNETFELLTQSISEKIKNEQKLLQRELRQLTIDNKKLEKTTTRQEAVISDLRERVRYLLDFNDQRSSQLKDEIANLKRIINHTLSNSSFSNALLETEELRNLSEEQENTIKRLERTVEKSDEKIEGLISTLIESYNDKTQIINQTNQIAKLQKDLKKSIKKNKELEAIIELNNASVNLPEKLLEQTSSSSSSSSPSSSSSSSSSSHMTENERISAESKKRFAELRKVFLAK